MKKLKSAGNRIIKDIKGYGMAGVVLVVYYFVVHFFRRAFCPMVTITGFPCAGCGLTRTFLYLLQGQLEKAAYLNPMAFPIIGFCLYCGYFRYIKGSAVKGFGILFSILIAVILIFYAYRMYLYFPDRVPYTYARDNILAQRIPGYQELADRLIKIVRASRLP